MKCPFFNINEGVWVYTTLESSPFIVGYVKDLLVEQLFTDVMMLM